MQWISLSKNLGRKTFSVLSTTALSLGGAAVLATPAQAQGDMCRPYNPSFKEQINAFLTGSDSLGSSGSRSPILGSSSLSGASDRESPSKLPVVAGPTEALYQFTGPDSPDQTEKLGLGTTDLGIMWDSGDGRTLVAFGDSFRCASGGGPSDGWHSNALFESTDANPAVGFSLAEVATGKNSAEFLPAALHVDGVEMTKIPTAGIEVNGVQYVDFMSVKKWGIPGEWTTNYAETVESHDGGQTWDRSAGSTRTNTNPSSDSRISTGLPSHVPGLENFQLSAFVVEDDYVYAFGTPNGRSGSARLARISTEDFPSWDDAQFWDGSTWSNSARAAEPVINDRVSEMHVHFNDHLGKWVALYENSSGIVLRTATALTGTWGPATTVVPRNQVPGIYGAYAFPAQQGKDLYFVATMWDAYNPTVFRTDLDELLR